MDSFSHLKSYIKTKKQIQGKTYNVKFETDSG